MAELRGESGGQGRNQTTDTRIFSTLETPFRRDQGEDREGFSRSPTEPTRPTEPILNPNPETLAQDPRARSGSTG